MKKPCQKCFFQKPLSEFHKKNGGKWGVDSICKHCISFIKKARAEIKKADLKKQKSRTFYYGKELMVEPTFRGPTSTESHQALDLLLSSINNNLIKE